MKRMTLKTRLVLLHTAMMTVVVCGVLAVLFSAGFREILTNVRGTLETRVSRSVEDVEYNNGRLEFDSELLALDNGVYLSVYEPDSPDLLYGRLPYGFTYDLPFSDGALRTVTAGDTEYCVLDIEFPVEGYHDLVLRGIVSVSDAERDFRYTLRLALILSPALVLLTAVCGYLLSRRARRSRARCGTSRRKRIFQSACGSARAAMRSTRSPRRLTACWTPSRRASGAKSSLRATSRTSCARRLRSS